MFHTLIMFFFGYSLDVIGNTACMYINVFLYFLIEISH